METLRIEVATQVTTTWGVVLPWVRRERYGSDLRYPAHHARAGQLMYPDRKPTGTVIDSGKTFVSVQILEELLEADNSLGMGGAYLIHGDREGAALEEANLATKETRGGFYTTAVQRRRIEQVLEEVYADQAKEAQA